MAFNIFRVVHPSSQSNSRTFFPPKEAPYTLAVILYPPSHPAAAAAAKSLQSCPTLCDPRDGSLPGSSVPGILQARTPEWVAISFSNANLPLLRGQ